MAKRDELLKDLKDYLSFEEELIGKYSVFYRSLDWRKHIKEEYHKEIEVGLGILRDESQKHADMLNGLIKYIEASTKDEF
ncbi:MAG: hypothetical protein Q8R05_00820 [Candidatus Omnitrophota bacterium]|nr:hypothetical protein [Candidatus Omnitrophota bacterium]